MLWESMKRRGRQKREKRRRRRREEMKELTAATLEKWGIPVRIGVYSDYIELDSVHL